MRRLPPPGAREIDGSGDLPLALAQHLLQVSDDRQVAGEAGDLPLIFQRLVDTLEIGGGLVHVRLFDLDEAQARAGIEFDGAGIGLLADDLLVDLRLRRHVDDEIAHDPGLAGEAAARRQGRAACRSAPRPWRTPRHASRAR